MSYHILHDKNSRITGVIKITKKIKYGFPKASDVCTVLVVSFRRLFKRGLNASTITSSDLWAPFPPAEWAHIICTPRAIKTHKLN